MYPISPHTLPPSLPPPPSQCKATLEEHARWSQVVREAKNFLESGGRLSDSADR